MHAIGRWTSLLVIDILFDISVIFADTADWKNRLFYQNISVALQSKTGHPAPIFSTSHDYGSPTHSYVCPVSLDRPLGRPSTSHVVFLSTCYQTLQPLRWLCRGGCRPFFQNVRLIVCGRLGDGNNARFTINAAQLVVVATSPHHANPDGPEDGS